LQLPTAQAQQMIKTEQMALYSLTGATLIQTVIKQLEMKQNGIKMELISQTYSIKLTSPQHGQQKAKSGMHQLESMMELAGVLL